MYKLIQNGNLGLICEEISKLGLMIEKLELAGGLYKALCKDGAPKGTFVKEVMNPNAELSIKEINTYKGVIEKSMFLSGGSTKFIARFDKKEFSKIEKDLEEKTKKEAEEKAKAEIDAKKAELEAKKKELDKELEELK